VRLAVRGLKSPVSGVVFGLFLLQIFTAVTATSNVLARLVRLSAQIYSLLTAGVQCDPTGSFMRKSPLFQRP
jgi:hypothetical protein